MAYTYKDKETLTDAVNTAAEREL
jgi:adenylate kinase family enzyme